MTNKPNRIDIWHNILWSKYKGEVFSSVHKLNNPAEFDIRFIQIAETEGNRVGLGGVDKAHHRYPYDLLFKGAYDGIGLPRRIWALATRTLKSDADLVLLTGYEKIECWVQLILLKLKGKKVAVFCDSTINDQHQTFIKGLFKRIIFSTVDGIFGYGLRSKEYVMAYGANENTIYHRCQAAALPFDYTPEKALTSRLANVAAPNAPRFLYVGRLSPEKGLDTLLHAFAKVRERQPAASLILVGSGPEREKLEGLARQLALGEAVTFAGSKSDAALFAEYSRATCFVLPSRSEPWGLVVNEAMHYGCPVIVSERCGCVPELVIEGQTGFVHKVDDVGDLSTKMLAALPAFADTKQTAQTCMTLMQNYTPDKAALQILDGVRKILGKNNHS